QSFPILAGLDPDQRAAAEIVAGPLLIIAGPGTGKTRTLTHRLAHLIVNNGVAPENCLAITFTRRAAGEMRERLAQLLPDGRGAPVWVTTFHSLGLTILREQENRLGLGAALRVVGEIELLALAREILGLTAAAVRKFAVAPASWPMDFLPALRKRGLVTFDDLIALAVGQLEGDAALAARCATRWPHIWS